MKEKIQSIVNNETTPAKTVDSLHKLFIEEQIRVLTELKETENWMRDAYSDSCCNAVESTEITELISQLKDQLK